MRDAMSHLLFRLNGYRSQPFDQLTPDLSHCSSPLLVSSQYVFASLLSICGSYNFTFHMVSTKRWSAAEAV